MQKKVLMVATVPSMIGQFNMDNIRILRDLGYEVDVAANFRDTSIWPADRMVMFKRGLDEQNIQQFQIDFSRSFFNIKEHVKSYRESKRLLESRRYKFVHTHTPIASAIMRVAAHVTKTKCVYTAHGFHFYAGAPMINWLVFYPIERILSRWTDVLITVNKEDFRRASKSFHAGKTIHIPGVGVETAKFEACEINRHDKRESIGINDGDFMLLSVGELNANKNQRVVIEALGRMKQEGDLKNTVYAIVGKGDLETALSELIAQNGLEENVRMLGYRSDVDELCKAADCFVHTSIREGLGIAPLEAMASGLPLISSRANGIKEYTEDGVSGCCVDPKDVDGMVSAIRKMRDDEEFRHKCGFNNRRTSKTYDIERSKAIMKVVYEGMAVTKCAV